jgi:squalene-hopene/tetraprenyl-beta-curcumene cyclase
MLALFGQVPWRAVPVMPVEIMLLPRWFPFHLDKVSYWARALIVPLLILMARKPRARNPRGIGIAELFLTPPEQERAYITSPPGATWGRFFLTVDRLLRLTEPLSPGRSRARSGTRGQAADRTRKGISRRVCASSKASAAKA